MTMISTAPSHLDRVLLMVGSPGRYHLLVAFLLCCMQFPVSFSDHLLTFYTTTPKHRCRAESNLTLGDYDLRPIVNEGGKRFYSACELYTDPLDHSKGTKPCDDGWDFLLKKGEYSVVTEWELVCERESLVAVLPYLTAVAAMVGSLVAGILADKYGRKYVLILSLLFHTSFGVFLHFLPLYGIFATVFSVQGCLIAGVQVTSYLLLIENLPTKWHGGAALAIAIFQCSGQLILASLAWLIRHWRYIQLVISAPGVVVIGYFWFVISLVSKCEIEDLPVFKDNPFSRLFVHGVIELAFVILIFLASGSVGLKLTQGTSLSVCGICCMFSAIINHQVIQMRSRFATEKGLHNFAPLFGLLGKSISSASRILLWMHAIKTFPTGIRGLGLGSCLLCSRVAYLFIPNIKELSSHSQFTVLAFGGVLSFIAGILSYWLLPDFTDRPLATIAEEIEIGRTKIINDSDLDFQDTNMASGFLPNIPARDSPSCSHTSDSINGTLKKNIIRRLTTLFQRKTQKFLHSTSDSISKLGCTKPLAPINSAIGDDVFEPVTGFVFKWDHAEPTVKITEFEKEMSAFWKPNTEPNEKKINDKHLNSLNILYNIESSNSDEDPQNDSLEIEINLEDPSDPTHSEQNHTET